MARPTSPDIRALRDRLMGRALRLTHSKADAEDLVQDVLLKIIDKGPDLSLEEMIRWSLVVMKNTHINLLIAGRTRVFSGAVEIDDQPELALNPSQEVAVFASEILRILGTLNPRFQRAIESAVLGANDHNGAIRATPKVTLHRARAALKERLSSSKKIAA